MYDQRCTPKRWSNIGSMLCTQRQRINQFPTLDLRKSAIGTQFTWLHFKKKTKMYRSNINITLLKPITVLHGKHIKWEPCLIATPDALISYHLPREFELFTCRMYTWFNPHIAAHKQNQRIDSYMIYRSKVCQELVYYIFYYIKIQFVTKEYYWRVRWFFF